VLVIQLKLWTYGPFLKETQTQRGLCASPVGEFSPIPASFTTHGLSSNHLTTNPKWSPPKYIYLKKTGTSNLCIHIQANHCKEYLKLIEEKGWVNMLPDMWQLTDQGSLNKHVIVGVPRLKFSQSAFINALVKFIVADDQVSLLVLHDHADTNYST